MKPTRPDVPGKPWSAVQIDTLELGDDGSGRFHCVLVRVDGFTKWAEVILLCRHDASCVLHCRPKMMKVKVMVLVVG